MTDATMEQMRALAERGGLADRWPEMQAAALPAFAADVVPGGPPLPAGSRLGGRPALPDSGHWPTVGGEALTFVGQLDLGAFDASIVGLPPVGLLGFFVGIDEPAANVVHAIRYFPDASRLRECAPPVARFHNDELTGFPACALRVQATVSLPQQLLWDLGDLGERLRRLPHPAPSGLDGRSRIGGHPQDGTGRDAYLCVSGRESILFHWHKTVQELQAERSRRPEGGVDGPGAHSRVVDDLEWFVAGRREHDEEIGHWRVLFSVDSHQAADMVWWDAGQLDFLIDGRDLARGRFDRTYACIVSS
ncbi:DUF1963 domain-containing protein [Planomonospora sp. ID67723]|uniref:DUF1963 domain-containing protein n=1 Tax=Planomonospora sp. ID67723 TaxID=2738134 RepID=UPI0018C43BBF|nr:DUF1963 domain-containing protein [Planomonospora sp. ID67723]MBG0831884.1 DUF1963 domain-containing protein [Planomonospora sp. ID67723]